jgi:Periplasmic binding protein domain
VKTLFRRAPLIEASDYASCGYIRVFRSGERHREAFLRRDCPHRYQPRHSSRRGARLTRRQWGGQVQLQVKRVGEDAKIGFVSGDPTSSNLNAWIRLIQKRVKEKYPNVKLLDPQFAGGSSDRSAQLSSDLMTANPDMKGLIAVASSNCPGVGQAIETAGR